MLIIFKRIACLLLFSASMDAVAIQIDNAPFNWEKHLSDPQGNVYLVSSDSDFNRYSKIAKPGDTIVVKDGVYSGWKLHIRSKGASKRKVVYTSQTRRGVIFRGNVRIKVTGHHNILAGFVFEELYPHKAIEFVQAKDNRFTGNEFYDAGKGNGKQRRIVTINIKDNSDRNRFDHNLMVGNFSFGIAVELPKDNDTSFGYSHDNRFDHNTFRDFVASGGTKQPLPIQIGQKVHTRDETRSLVDHNIFLNNNGTNVGSKSNGETYRFNRFINVPKGVALALRFGNNKKVEGNYFENVKMAIKVLGTNHSITDNVIVDAVEGVVIPRWGDYQIASGRISPSGPTGKIIIKGNTIVHTTDSAVDVGRRWGTAKVPNSVRANNLPFDVRINENIIVGARDKWFENKGVEKLEMKGNLFYRN